MKEHVGSDGGVNAGSALRRKRGVRSWDKFFTFSRTRGKGSQKEEFMGKLLIGSEAGRRMASQRERLKGDTKLCTSKPKPLYQRKK